MSVANPTEEPRGPIASTSTTRKSAVHTANAASKPLHGEECKRKNGGVGLQADHEEKRRYHTPRKRDRGLAPDPQSRPTALQGQRHDTRQHRADHDGKIRYFQVQFDPTKDEKRGCLNTPLRFACKQRQKQEQGHADIQQSKHKVVITLFGFSPILLGDGQHLVGGEELVNGDRKEPSDRLERLDAGISPARLPFRYGGSGDVQAICQLLLGQPPLFS